MKPRLYTPGPTPVPEQVNLKIIEPVIHHRTKEFRDLFARIQAKLQYVFQTQEDVFVLASSGTGAMEAAVANFLSRSDRALTIEGGKFGERWGELCEAYGIAVHRHKLGSGCSCELKELEELLRKDPGYDAIFLTHCETSTSGVLDLQAVAEVIHRNSTALIVVDGITSVGVLPMKMDEWGIDVVVSASQKAFRCPTGLAFIACSEKAWAAVESSDLPRYYFDMSKMKGSLANQNTPFTPATSLLFGLDEALKMMHDEGIENIWEKHRMLGAAFRSAVESLGLEIFSENPSDSLTAIKIPDSLLEQNLVRLLKDKGCVVAGGQGELKNRIFRISHMGYCNADDLSAVLSALEEVLISCGWSVKPGMAAAKFQQMLTSNSGNA